MADHDEAGSVPGGGPASDRLQNLLSRAAQEQLNEQRQLSAVLSDLRTLVVGIDEQLRAAPARRDEPLVDVEALADALAPRVADLLLERLPTELAGQVADRVAASVQEGLVEQVREAGDDADRRLAAHVDEAVVALARVLLRPAGRRAAEAAPPAAVRVRPAGPVPPAAGAS